MKLMSCSLFTEYMGGRSPGLLVNGQDLPSNSVIPNYSQDFSLVQVASYGIIGTGKPLNTMGHWSHGNRTVGSARYTRREFFHNRTISMALSLALKLSKSRHRLVAFSERKHNRRAEVLGGRRQGIQKSSKNISMSQVYIIGDMERYPTRGSGLLENFLAWQRSKCANRLIPSHYRNGRILDIGCGRTPLFLLYSGVAEKFGLDKIVDDTSRAYYYERGIRLIHYDIETDGQLPFDDGYFDVVTMLAVYEHVEQESLQLILGEVHRILRPGGLHIATTPVAWTDNLLRCMARLHFVSSTEIEEHKEVYTPGKILPMLQRANFGKNMVVFGYFEMFMNLFLRATK